MPENRHSVCALDCPDCCSLLVTVENGRGQKLRGDPAHPVTGGFLCGKVAQYLEHEYSPARLFYPQRRVGAKGEGRFEHRKRHFHAGTLDYTPPQESRHGDPALRRKYPLELMGKRSPGKRNVNALTSERLTDAGGGPAFYSCLVQLVQVERIGD
jgi:anaerobic selenocysteine-containing dehydrogenase